MKALKLFVSAVLGVIIALVLLTAAKPQTASEGKSLYDAKCAICHAEDGTGNPAMKGMAGGDLSKLNVADSKLSDADMFTVIRDGRNKMPAYKGKITDEQIKSVVTYIRTLKK